MRIAEIYRSRQGEGLLTGTSSVFVRTSGCNLRCWYCDTPYTSWDPEGDDLSVEEILAEAEALAEAPSAGRRHAVLTGGEPMLFAELVPLTSELSRQGWHITIETAGTLYLPVVCDLMSISPKLSGSTPPADKHLRWSQRHQRSRHVPEVIRRLVAEYSYQFKFVIDRPPDCDEVQRYLAEFPEFDRERVLLMPQGTSSAELAERAQWLEPYCREHAFRFCPRRHIEWYGFTRKT